MFYPMFIDFVVFSFIFEIMLRNHVRRLEQRTLVSLLSTLTKCAETHIRRLRRCPFYNTLYIWISILPSIYQACPNQFRL